MVSLLPRRREDFGLSEAKHPLTTAEGRLFLLDVESKKSHELFSPPEGDVLNPKLSKDNRTLYFALRILEADIWMLTLNR